MRLTVAWQVEDQVDHEGDEHAGYQDVDDVEERFAANDEVEGDVLVVDAVHRDAGVHIDLGCPVYYLPFTVLCGKYKGSLGSSWRREPMGLRSFGTE